MQLRCTPRPTLRVTPVDTCIPQCTDNSVDIWGLCMGACMGWHATASPETTARTKYVREASIWNRLECGQSGRHWAIEHGARGVSPCMAVRVRAGAGRELGGCTLEPPSHKLEQRARGPEGQLLYRAPPAGQVAGKQVTMQRHPDPVSVVMLPRSSPVGRCRAHSSRASARMPSAKMRSSRRGW